MADDEGVVALPFRFDRIADHLAGAAEFDDWMRVIVVRCDAIDFDNGAGVDNRREVSSQPVPISFAVFLIDEALIPNADGVQNRLQSQSRVKDARYKLMLAILAPPQT